jgi:hypothetical protein
MGISYRTESDMARGIYSRRQYTRFSFNEYDVGQWETEGYVRAVPYPPLRTVDASAFSDVTPG